MFSLNVGVSPFSLELRSERVVPAAAFDGSQSYFDLDDELARILAEMAATTTASTEERRHSW
jgi:hypothetical protein